MCVSATVSFGMAGLLIAGGSFAAHKARETDTRYVPLALFSVLVGIQQLTEGLVWIGAEADAQGMVRIASLGYLFFAWMVWPSWVPYMAARLEDNKQKRKLFLHFAQAGFLLGLALYLPNFWHTDWLNTEINNHSISYQCTLITNTFMPRAVPYLFYLSIIAAPLLLSSHRSMKILGTGLVVSVPLTYSFFSYAGVSVLCFFGAMMMLYIIHVILENKCAPLRTEVVT